MNQKHPSNDHVTFQNQKMTSSLQSYLLTCLIIYASSLLLPVLSRGPVYKPPPTVERLTERFHPAPVTQKMSTLYGGSNIQMKSNGAYADITLDKTSGKNERSSYITNVLLNVEIIYL